ncbi:MAG: hypothetical protein GX575_24605 [Candidatus Anammoximicrobium sp.]|nr:hypothetical protein [Candidatus Anammoximicrobium sp.]
MRMLTRDVLRSLLPPRQPPCISLYLPTHRHHPDNQQDPIRYRNLVRQAEESLRQKYASRDIARLLEPFRDLAVNAEFWENSLDGLAVVGAAEEFEVFQLQQPVRELAIVAGSFHVKPLLRSVQSADRFQVLCLTRQTAGLFEGTRYALDSLDAGEMPTTLTAALGDQRTEPHLTVASYGKGPNGPVMRHGHGAKADEVDKDTERFFRVIDQEVLVRFSKPSGLPLILAAPAEHHADFRAVSKNPFLAKAAVEVHPDALDAEQLREAVWRVVEPQYLARLAALCEAFGTAAAQHKGSADLSDVARAAVQSRVATLLVEADRVEPGHMDPASGAIQRTDLDHPDVEDLLDDVAEAVLQNGGEVIVVPKDQMPSSSGVAATYRY